MESPAHALLSLWETCYVILGGSAAALTGLQFVVLAIASDTETLGSGSGTWCFRWSPTWC